MTLKPFLAEKDNPSKGIKVSGMGYRGIPDTLDLYITIACIVTLI
jgi:hypothetical protein